MPVMPWSKGEVVKGESSNLKIENIREEKPAWGRRYVTRLDNRAVLTVSAWCLLGSRTVDGELRQPDGRIVIFQPKEIADKIIDRTLVPLVREACDEILSLDRAYMKSNRREFTDESGTVWRS